MPVSQLLILVTLPAVEATHRLKWLQKACVLVKPERAYRRDFLTAHPSPLIQKTSLTIPSCTPQIKTLQ